jgi:hypothetical protein
MNKINPKVSRSIRDLYLLYVLPIRDEQLTSVFPFRGFTPEIVRIAPLITWVLRQPYHVVQFLMPRESLLQHRLCGAGHRIIPVQISSLLSSPPVVDDQQPFCCIVTSEETSSLVAEYLTNLRRPVLHVSQSQQPGSVRLENVSPETFCSYFVEAINAVTDADSRLLHVRKNLLSLKFAWFRFPSPSRLTHQRMLH